MITSKNLSTVNTSVVKIVVSIALLVAKKELEIVKVTRKCLQVDVTMNVIGGLQQSMFEFFFLLVDTSICKSYVVKFVVSLASLKEVLGFSY